MAAHALTGLIQVTHELLYADEVPSHYSGLFNTSCWSEDIDYNCWVEAYEAFKEGDLDRVFEAFAKALPKAVRDWLELGRPRTREDWMKTKYYGDEE